KPANILLTMDGQPKVTDFGLVKRLDDKSGPTRESGHTSPGEILGTIGYMAPEQIDHSHAKIGPRTDVYALGTLLYEMLTGEPPFASHPALTLRQVLQDDVPLPTRLRPSVPRDVEAICLKCLEKDVADRYASAEDLADDLRRYSEHRPILARRIGTARRTLKWVKRRPQVAAFMLAIIVAILTARPIMLTIGERRARAKAVRVAPLAREILQRNCYACHGGDPEDVRKQLDVLDHDLLLDSDRRIVVPYKPEESRLVQRIADGSMPPEEMETMLPRLTQKELDILNEWILGGAPEFPAEDPENPTSPVVEFSTIAAKAEKVFQDRCYTCHKHDDAKGGIKILNHRLLLHVRKVVVPGNLDESELFQLIIGKPPHPSKPLSAVEIDIIRRWIVNGAPPFPKSED
ncbi:MAG: protein kinase, partial [Proteobacteria bacterium]|nr:protein kinase [Pseudomonadota bacterium]